MYLLLLGEEHDEVFPELLPPKAFLGARAATTVKIILLNTTYLKLRSISEKNIFKCSMLHTQQSIQNVYLYKCLDLDYLMKIVIITYILLAIHMDYAR